MVCELLVFSVNLNLWPYVGPRETTVRTLRLILLNLSILQWTRLWLTCIEKVIEIAGIQFVHVNVHRYFIASSSDRPRKLDLRMSAGDNISVLSHYPGFLPARATVSTPIIIILANNTHGDQLS